MPDLVAADLITALSAANHPATFFSWAFDYLDAASGQGPGFATTTYATAGTVVKLDVWHGRKAIKYRFTVTPPAPAARG